jgi:hypothetical protein
MRQRFHGLFLGMIALACSNPVGPGLSDQDQLVLQVTPGLDWRVLPDDQVTITDARVEGRTLHLSLQFGGGCKTHRFALVAGAELGESNPPYTLLRLAHDGHDDFCDALVTRNLEVDLSPIVPLVQQSGAAALRFELVEPGEHVSGVGELLLTF